MVSHLLTYGAVRRTLSLAAPNGGPHDIGRYAMTTVDLHNVTCTTGRMTRDDALTVLGGVGWHHAVNLPNVLTDALGDRDTYAAADVYELAGY